MFSTAVSSPPVAPFRQVLVEELFSSKFKMWRSESVELDSTTSPTSVSESLFSIGSLIGLDADTTNYGENLQVNIKKI